MKNDFYDSRLVTDLAGKLGGVFTIFDLANMFAQSHRTALYRRIRRLEELGVLSRFSRGVYVSSDYRAEVLSQKLAPESYISFGNVLADALIIGSRPDYQIDAVKNGKTRVYSHGDLTIRHLGCSERVFFGYVRTQGIQRASPEKAFLDTLYFHQHGVRFFFDIYSDVNVGMLDEEKLAGYLAQYSNPKFVGFAKGFFG